MQGKKACQLLRVLEVRWLYLSYALDEIEAQWDTLAAYFARVANNGGPDMFSLRQLRDLYTPKHKMIIVFVSERIRQLNKLNKLFQSEQPNQAILLDHLMAYYYGVLEEVITAEGLCSVKNATDPLLFDFEPYRKAISEMHFRLECSYILHYTNLSLISRNKLLI